jgi:hypothetical protein
MSRRLVAPAVLLASLLLAAPASPSIKADGASVMVTVTGGNQFVFEVQNTGDSVIQSFVLTLGSGFTPGSLTGPAACQLAGSSVSCGGLALAPGCPCRPGDSVSVRIVGSGDPAGSSVGQIVGLAAPPTTTTTSSPAASMPIHTATTASAAKPAVATVKKKKLPLCKKGQRSTKKKPCRR